MEGELSPQAIILNAEPENYSEEARKILATFGRVEEGPFSRSELAARLSRPPFVDILIVRLAHHVDAALLSLSPHLKMVGTATTGLNHIDLAAAKERGIVVVSLRGETEFLRSIPATAEHTWGLLLALVRRIPAAFESVKAGEWERNRFRGHDLAGKTLGILGLGRIGEKVARYGLAFGMKVLAYDPYKPGPPVAGHPDVPAAGDSPTGWMQGVVRCASQQELFQASQVLSIHVPLEASTVNLVGAAELALLPPGAVLVNTARGEILDEAALLDALESGHLAGAALDVVWNELTSDVAKSPLLEYARTHDNLVITPHIGGATVESMAHTEIFIAQKLKKAWEGRNL